LNRIDSNGVGWNAVAREDNAAVRNIKVDVGTTKTFARRVGIVSFGDRNDIQFPAGCIRRLLQRSEILLQNTATFGVVRRADLAQHNTGPDKAGDAIDVPVGLQVIGITGHPDNLFSPQ